MNKNQIAKQAAEYGKESWRPIACSLETWHGHDILVDQLADAIDTLVNGQNYDRAIMCLVSDLVEAVEFRYEEFVELKKAGVEDQMHVRSLVAQMLEDEQRRTDRSIQDLQRAFGIDEDEENTNAEK